MSFNRKIRYPVLSIFVKSAISGYTSLYIIIHQVITFPFLIVAVDEDIERTANILEQYIDSRIDFVDACIMAIAERLNIQTILTIDQRDFRLFRPKHCDHFILKP